MLPHHLGAVALAAAAQGALASVRLGAIGMTTPSNEEVVRDTLDLAWERSALGDATRRAALAALTALVEERDEAVAYASEMHADAAEFLAENARLRAALQWYAEQDDINNYVAIVALSTNTEGGEDAD